MFEWFINKIAFARRNILSLNKKAARPKHSLDQKIESLNNAISDLYAEMRNNFDVLDYVNSIMNIKVVKNKILSSARKVKAYNKILDVEDQIGTYLSDYGALIYLLYRFVLKNASELDLTKPNANRFLKLFDEKEGFSGQSRDLNNILSREYDILKEKTTTEKPFSAQEDPNGNTEERISNIPENTLSDSGQDPARKLQEKEDSKANESLFDEGNKPLLQRVDSALRTYPTIRDAFRAYVYSVKHQPKTPTKRNLDVKLLNKLSPEIKEDLSKYISITSGDSVVGKDLEESVNTSYITVTAPKKWFGVEMTLAQAEAVTAKLKEITKLLPNKSSSRNLIESLKTYRDAIASLANIEPYKSNPELYQALLNKTNYNQLKNIISEHDTMQEKDAKEYLSYLRGNIQKLSDAVNQSKKQKSTNLYKTYYSDIVKDRAAILNSIKYSDKLSDEDKANITYWLGNTFNDIIKNLGQGYSNLLRKHGSTVGEELSNEAFAHTLEATYIQQTVDTAEALRNSEILSELRWDTIAKDVADNAFGGRKPNDERWTTVRDFVRNSPSNLYELQNSMENQKLFNKVISSLRRSMISEVSFTDDPYAIRRAISRETGFQFPKAYGIFDVGETADVLNSGAMREILGIKARDTSDEYTEVDEMRIYKVYPDIQAYKAADGTYYPVKKFRTLSGYSYSVDWDNPVPEPVVVNPQAKDINGTTYIYGANTEKAYKKYADGSLIETNITRDQVVSGDVPDSPFNELKNIDNNSAEYKEKVQELIDSGRGYELLRDGVVSPKDGDLYTRTLSSVRNRGDLSSLVKNKIITRDNGIEKAENGEEHDLYYEGVRQLIDSGSAYTVLSDGLLGDSETDEKYRDLYRRAVRDAILAGRGVDLIVNNIITNPKHIKEVVYYLAKHNPNSIKELEQANVITPEEADKLSQEFNGKYAPRQDGFVPKNPVQSLVQSLADNTALTDDDVANYIVSDITDRQVYETGIVTSLLNEYFDQNRAKSIWDKIKSFLNSNKKVNTNKEESSTSGSENAVPDITNPTTEEENQTATSGFYFGIQKSASFFLFANSTDHYNIYDPKINNDQQRLLEDPSGFMYNEPRQDSMEGDKKKSKEFSMEKLGKVFNAIKDSSESAFNEIKDLVKQSSAKSGDDLVRYLELWAENNWNGEKAVEAYNETAVDHRDRAYFWGMFKRNVLPQIENLPSFVNAINAMSNSKAVDASDVNTSEYKYVGNKPIN